MDKVCLALSFVLALLVSGVISSCEVGDGNEEESSNSTESTKVDRLQTLARLVSARPELPDDEVDVSHILVKVGDNPTGENRSEEEALELAGEILAEYLDSPTEAKFEELRQKHTEDVNQTTGEPNDRVYEMNQGSRTGMVEAFWYTGWRLHVGEVGVALYEPKDRKSPFGIHIIKRMR